MKAIQKAIQNIHQTHTNPLNLYRMPVMQLHQSRCHTNHVQQTLHLQGLPLLAFTKPTLHNKPRAKQQSASSSSYVPADLDVVMSTIDPHMSSTSAFPGGPRANLFDNQQHNNQRHTETVSPVKSSIPKPMTLSSSRKLHSSDNILIIHSHTPVLQAHQVLVVLNCQVKILPMAEEDSQVATASAASVVVSKAVGQFAVSSPFAQASEPRTFSNALVASAQSMMVQPSKKRYVREESKDQKSSDEITRYRKRKKLVHVASPCIQR